MFNFKRRSYFCDTDTEGVVYHSRYLDFCEQARTEFMISVGFPQRDSVQKHNIMFVVREINIEYKSPARFESEINISIDKIEIKDPFIVFYQTVSNVEDMKTLVKVIVHCVCVDGNFKLLKKIPDIVRKLIL